MSNFKPEHNPPQRDLFDEDCLRLDRMNLGKKQIDEILQELRIKYAHDMWALKQLDGYDPNSAYTQKVWEAYEAGKNHDEAKFKEIQKWMKDNGYEGI